MSHAIAFGPRVRKSPFFTASEAAGARAYSTYNHMYMPVSYGDPAAEYRRLTEGVALWDVAIERQIALEGPDAEQLAIVLSARDLAGMPVGLGRYAPLCDHEGRLINDPIALKVAEDCFWLSIADSDVLLWARAIAAERRFDVRVYEADVAPLAVQGPLAQATIIDAIGEDWPKELKPFRFRPARIGGVDVIVARSGWSKQGGFEVYLAGASADPERACALYEALMKAGEAYDIGPGAPNYVERVESGLLSLGADTDAETTPLELGLERFVDLDRETDFIGKDALLREREQGPARRLIGAVLGGPRMLAPNAHPFALHDETGRAIGSIRAAAFSPRFEANIAIALVDSPAIAAAAPDFPRVPEALADPWKAQSDLGPIPARPHPLPFLPPRPWRQ